MTLLLLPVAMALLIVGCVFIGFYVSEMMGNTGSIFYPILFATVGFVASIAVSLVIIRHVLQSS
jgi:hypothetical protein